MFIRSLAALVTVAILAPAARAADISSPAAIQFLERRIVDDPDDIVALNRLSAQYMARFRDTGDDADLERAALAAAQSLNAVPGIDNPGALAARARSSFSLHRFAAARDDARRLIELLPSKRYPLEILGDALLELGDYAEAADIYRKMASFPGADPDATTEVRLARIALAQASRDEADKRFDAAIDRAKDSSGQAPHVLAWAQVQAGGFDFSSGRWEQAEAHYLAALEARPDDWPALDHLAELRAAQGRFDESVAIYTKLIARIPRPELFQALGDVYLARKDPESAKPWHARAGAAYLEAAAKGSAHYFHHLAGFYCDVEVNPPEALRWAREDLKLRHTADAHDALAWALYHTGDFPAAATAMDGAIATGACDAHVLYHASLIYARAGRTADARDCLRKAASVNPKFMSFHVHR